MNLQMNETRSIEAYYPDLLKKIISLSHLLVIVNSSVNFIIYCLGTPPFRMALARKFACLRRCREGTEARPQVGMIQMATPNDSNSTVRTLAVGQSRQDIEAHSHVVMTNVGARSTLTAPLSGKYEELWQHIGHFYC